MGEPVRQELSLDAQKAIQELKKLRTELLSANAQLINTGSVLGQVNTAGAAFPGTVERSARALGQFRTQSSGLNPQLQANVEQIKLVDQAIKQLSGTTTQSSRSILLSWQSVVRIFTGDLIRRGFLQAVRGAKELIGESHNLEIQFARVGTISEKFRGNITGLRDAVLSFSAAFAEQREEVTTGIYDILTNQVADGAQSFRVLSAAQKLSLATGTDLGKSVDINSAVLKSYSESADNAATISGKLFRIVDIGRFKLDDISGSFGRVTALSNELTVDFNEVGAALATLSNRGIGADESMTLLNNVFLALLKPSDALQRAFRELGVETARAGIQASGGFVPFLDRLTRMSPEVGAQLSELAPNIRALRGLLGLSGESAALFAENLTKVRDASAQTLEEVSKLVDDTLARKTEKNLAALNNFFFKLADIGRVGLAGLLDFGVEQIGDRVNRGIQRISDDINKAFGDGQQVLNRELQSQSQELVAQARQLAKERVDAEKSELDRAITNIQAHFTERRKIEQDAQKEALALQDQLFSGLNSQIGSRIKAFSEFAQGVRKVAQEGEQNLSKISTTIQNTQNDLAAFRSDRLSLRFDDGGIRQVTTQLARADELRRQGVQLSKSQIEVERQQGQQLLEQAETLAKQALSKADASGNAFLIRSSESAVDGILQSQLQSQQSILTAERDRINTAKANADRITEQEGRIKKLFDEIKKFQVLDFKDGKVVEKILSPQDAERAKTIFNKLQDELVAAGKDLPLASTLGLDASLRAAREQILNAAGQPVPIQFAADEAIAAVKAKFLSTFSAEPIPIRFQLQEIIGPTRTVEEAQRKLSEQQEALNNTLNKQQDDLAKNKGALDTSVAGILQGFQQQVAALDTVVAQDNPIAKWVQEANTAILSQDTTKLQELAKRFTEAQTQIQQIQANQSLSAFTPFGKGAQVDQVVQDVGTVRQAVETVLQRMESISGARTAFELTQLQVDTTNDKLTNLKQVIADLATEVQNLGDATRNVEIPVPRVTGRQMGGLIPRFQRGGIAQKGTDAVLAALTPGERVVPVGPSRAFATQIAAISAGMRPNFRQSGGVVNNIGDVHIHAPEGSTDVQIRAIGERLERAIRKGALKLS